MVAELHAAHQFRPFQLVALTRPSAGVIYWNASDSKTSDIKRPPNLAHQGCDSEGFRNHFHAAI
jgi:hypothetical protein